MEARRIRPVVDTVFPFESAREALEYVEAGHAKAGKVVLRMTWGAALPGDQGPPQPRNGTAPDNEKCPQSA
ncbi:zinc-binding dehydrogenase [Streptomyces sp. NPDC002888]|uniref:zinc-binding dehydrogenase n=1 Tax=Streptomyces sp. NPDC002888 TaxID=3364668 RepID=UPI003699AB8F